ncbi:YihY/virulence factor BrkB family protein [Canibacter zhoujuaniae]|uniref:YihY/virulence factor BrkB family protein n=1 Tax=Canibacter zhoujuaniae TaxID=2708343 RepID=UPI0014237A26|nr:YihY/virulence factor BrkB family protein [Canibacter zhoujuaniae]
MTKTNDTAATAGAETANHGKSLKDKVLALVEKLQRSRPLRANTNLTENGGEVLSAGMSFQALFAVFAALWVGFSSFGFYLRRQPELLKALIENLDTLIPGLFGEGGAIDVQDLLDSPALGWSNAIAIASLFLLVLTWFNSTRSSIRLINGLDAVPGRNGIILKLRDLLFAVGFGVLILLSSVLSISSTAVLNFIENLEILPADSWIFGGLGTLLRFGTMFLLNWFVLFAIHKWLAELKIPAKRIWLGTIPGAIGLVVLTVLGSSLLGGASRNPLLASFAVIVGLLLWFNFICRVLLFTASWIAAGEDKSCGLPAALREKDLERAHSEETLANAGIAYTGAESGAIDINSIEPAARVKR